MSIVVKNACKRRKGYLYHIDKDGNLIESKMSRDRTPYQRPKAESVKKKMKKMEKEALILKFREDDLNRIKERFNEYLEALVRYDDGDIGLYAIRAHKMFQDDLTRRLRESIKNKRSFMSEVLGKPGKKLTEVERVQSSIDYYQKLINIAKMKTSNLDHKVKMRMASDGITYMNHYWNSLDRRLGKIKQKKLNDALQKDGE